MCHFHYTTYCYTLPYQNAHKNKEKKPCKHDAARFSKTVLVPILSNQRAWNYVAISQAILGIQPDYDGLRIDPCIPPSWKEYTIEREFRGTVYRIRVTNPEGISKGAVRILVDGKEIEGNRLPLFTDGRMHRVEVVMGRS